MRRPIALLVATMLLGLAACVPRSPEPPSFQANVVRRITIEETTSRMESGENVVFLDARERLVGPVIKDAVHVPYTWLGKWAKGQSRDALIIVYCACLNEASAARSVLDLQRDGFTNAYALRGGFRAWAAAGLPIEIRR